MKRLIQSHSRHLFLKPGEIIVTEEPVLVTTVLGSCIAVTMFSPSRKAAAICHAMLPWSRGGERDLRYVDTALLAIHERMVSLGGSHDMKVKLFGGANVIDFGTEGSRLTIGSQNVAAAEELLAHLSIPVEARDTGGTSGRKLVFCTRSGDVYLRRITKTIT